jgi:Neuraminidase-like domain
VFLFPENWLLPELRDDKTAIFKEMEGALTQQEETTLYAVGRMPNQTSRYFWRSGENFGNPDLMSWSGWEALDIDNANDFIMPFVMAGDLHLAWPVFNKKVDEKDASLLLWDVQIAWTRRTNEGWVKRKIGSVTLSKVTRLPNKDEAASFVFRLTKEMSTSTIWGDQSLVQETIKISCYAATEVEGFQDSLGFDSQPPGPALKGTNLDANGSQWNVSLNVTGAVYRYAIVGADKITYSRPFDPAVNITLTYDQRQHDDTTPGGVQNLPPIQVSTKGDGTSMEIGMCSKPVGSYQWCHLRLCCPFRPQPSFSLAVDLGLLILRARSSFLWQSQPPL